MYLSSPLGLIWNTLILLSLVQIQGNKLHCSKRSVKDLLGKKKRNRKLGFKTRAQFYFYFHSKYVKLANNRLLDNSCHLPHLAFSNSFLVMQCVSIGTGVIRMKMVQL
jgi:hypothetical protein